MLDQTSGILPSRNPFEVGLLQLAEVSRKFSVSEKGGGIQVTGALGWGVAIDPCDFLLSPALWAEAAVTRLDVRLQDGLLHQPEGGLHDPHDGI